MKRKIPDRSNYVYLKGLKVHCDPDTEKFLSDCIEANGLLRSYVLSEDHEYFLANKEAILAGDMPKAHTFWKQWKKEARAAIPFLNKIPKSLLHQFMGKLAIDRFAKNINQHTIMPGNFYYYNATFRNGYLKLPKHNKGIKLGDAYYTGTPKTVCIYKKDDGFYCDLSYIPSDAPDCGTIPVYAPNNTYKPKNIKIDCEAR